MAKDLYRAVDSPWLVPFDGDFKVKKARSALPKSAPPKEERLARLATAVARLDELQRALYADDHHAVLLVFQAMDAAGKDSTIRAVLTGVDPAGCEVYSFKAPSKEELDHDFLWRTARCLPSRGRIGVFNRSYYEEVLAVRVHPEFLEAQKLPRVPKHLDELFEERLDSIVEHERHLARNGTRILKFWLNVSRDEQKRRFLERLEAPEKNWKFESADIRERARWPEYMRAYEQALRATSRPWAPWYAIPADSKSYMRMTVAEILVQALESLDLKYPGVQQKTLFASYRRALKRERDA
jgi:PPK2 family polyphosphate:nucleotide phosphotransferase